MLAKRRLALSSSAVLTQPLLRREVLADIQLASEVLGSARLEAEQLLEDTATQAQQQMDQALAQFWLQANAVLDGMAQQRLALERECLIAVEELLTGTLSRLLDEASLGERVRALLRQLADSQSGETTATLSCHPQMLESLTEWLQDSRFAGHWQLKGDPQMAPLSLHLSDANGALDIDWDSLRRGLLGLAPAS
ncbi:type III secretion system stator protein SctL [Pseudomonas sp. NPDC090202]|uniref:type III secretion system stator protein SctL n=1 Tax=unclassified Pseudomonas TaxID=196821 RepID=UPI0037F2D849